MDCVSLKNLSFLNIHEEGLFKCEIFEDLPFNLKEEFHDKKRCCFFSYGKYFSSQSIKRYAENWEHRDHWIPVFPKEFYDYVIFFVESICFQASRNGHLLCFKNALETGIARTYWKLQLKPKIIHPADEFKRFKRMWFESFIKGHVDILLYGMKMGFKFDSFYFEDAATNGCLNILTCPDLTNGMNMEHEKILMSAAEHGHVHILEYYFEHWKDRIASFIQPTIRQVFQLRHQPNVIKFLFNHAKEHFSDSIWTVIALESNCAELVNLGIENIQVLPDGFWKTAAKKGNVAALRFAIERKIPLEESVWVNTAFWGMFECLKLALDNDIFLGENVWQASSQNNFENRSIFCLIVALRHGIQLSDNVWKSAVKWKNIEFLRTAWAYGINFSDDVLREINRDWLPHSAFKGVC